MNAGIRRVGAAMMLLFLGLVAQLTYLQVARSDRLANDPRNTRNFLRDVRRPRGPIVSADGVVLARSERSGDEFERRRVYPADTAKLFAHVVGFQSLQFGSVGVERQYSGVLAGRGIRELRQSLADTLANREIVGTVYLTLSRRAQQAAADALAGRRGSVVVLDVRSGGVVAMYSNPTFDPNLLAAHNVKFAQAARQLLLADPTNPMLPRAWRELYPPGSTFKTVTAAVALEAGVTRPDQRYPRLKELGLPLTTKTLKNFGGERCGGTLLDGFVESCNTTFGQVGLDLGDQLAAGVQSFGIGTDPSPSDLDPGIARSTGPQGPFKTNAPLFAQAAIGQADVAVTPLEMALVAESVATGGVILQPHVMDCVKDPDDRVVRSESRREWRRAMNPATADTLRDFMTQVVQRGTGTAARIPGITVAGKTGTAQTVEGQHPHAWFIAFAPAAQPRYAIAVLVEHGGDLGSEATGGRVAAPVAKQVLQSLLAQRTSSSQCAAPETPSNGR